MDLKDVGYEDGSWIELVNAVSMVVGFRIKSVESSISCCKRVS